MRRATLVLLLAALLAPAWGAARGRSTGSPSSSPRSHRVTVHKGTRSAAPRKAPKPPAARVVPRAPKSSTACATCARDGKGRIARNPAARQAFQRSTPCPSTGKTTGPCPGYVVDHVKPLKRGGADAPGNMQWQTTAAARAKDKIE
jgi:hypothetical protein